MSYHCLSIVNDKNKKLKILFIYIKDLILVEIGKVMLESLYEGLYDPFELVGTVSRFVQFYLFKKFTITSI